MIRFRKRVEFCNSFEERCDNATEGDIIYISRPRGGNVVLLELGMMTTSGQLLDEVWRCA